MTNGVKIEYALITFSIIIAEVDHVNKLDKFSFIEAIEIDEPYELQSINILPKIRENKLKKENCVGFGVNVAILDSGINEGPNSVIADMRESFCDIGTANDQGGYDGREHGTLVARIIKHIAPGSRIYNARIINKEGKIYKSNLLRALSWSYDNKANIINLSLSNPKQCNDKCMVCSVINDLYDKGILVSCAIGNYGRDGKGITGCPGNAINAITVGAVDINKKKALYSAIGRKDQGKPNIVAPGIIQLRSEAEPFTGTSFATPIVTGICAAMYNKVRFERIKEILYSTSTDLSLPFEEQGNGLINIERIIEVIKNEEVVS